MKKVNSLLMALFFILCAIYIIWVSTQRPRVFVLQSYTNDYLWTHDVDIAIRRTFKGTRYNVKYHYMDTKEHPGEDFKRIAGSLARKQISAWKPDILIAVDDNAQSLVAICYLDKSKLSPGPEPSVMKNEYSRSIFGECFESHRDMQILYAGIGANPEDYGFENQPHVSGILERLDVLAMRDVIVAISEVLGIRDLEITAPIDNSVSGGYNLDSLMQLKFLLERRGHFTLTPRVIDTFDEWSEMVEETNKYSDLLLFSNYHTVMCSDKPDAKRVNPQELIKWTDAHSIIPGIGGWGFYTDDGGMMAVGVSPYEQGEVVAGMAKKIIEGNLQASEVSIRTTRQSVISMREGLMRYYYDKNLPRVYEASARSVGQYYECQDQGELSLNGNYSPDHCKMDVEKIRERKQKAITDFHICQ